METDAQLELFDVPRQRAPDRSRMTGIGQVQLRYDHAMLCGIIALIGVAVVFGLGVERGKLLVRSERMLVGPQFGSMPAPAAAMAIKAERSAGRGGRPAAVPHAPAAAPTLRVVPKPPVKSVAANSTYAIQVVAYSKLKLARQELSQLLGKGERAFLIDHNDGRMVLCIGPFPSREHASVKLSRVKQRYRDCFIRSL
jgi:hypothetical protein